jgi:hypothetical protein
MDMQYSLATVIISSSTCSSYLNYIVRLVIIYIISDYEFNNIIIIYSSLLSLLGYERPTPHL